MKIYLGDKFDFDFFYVVNYQSDGIPPDWSMYDIVFSPYHRWTLCDILPYSKSLGSLRSSWFKPEDPRLPQPDDINLVNKFKAFHLVTKHNYDEVSRYCPNAVYLTNPVNTRRFINDSFVAEHLVAEWNGNAKHRSGGQGDIKGFYDIIKPACETAAVELVFAEYNTKRLAPSEMPRFFQSANVALCASKYEGASNSVMEAMSAGLAVIATDVGNHREMHEAQLNEFGDSGIVLVDRDPGAFVHALKELKKDIPRIKQMGQLNRQEIQKRWSWDVLKAGYEAFLLKAL
jgi:hypothetical protein